MYQICIPQLPPFNRGAEIGVDEEGPTAEKEVDGAMERLRQTKSTTPVEELGVRKNVMEEICCHGGCV